jgi:hypothetical protein
VNIAVSTVVILLALVPGIVFVNAYFAGRFPRELSQLTPLGELALYFLWALPIDAVALLAFHPPLGREAIDFVARCLLGQATLPLPGFVYGALEGLAWTSMLSAYLLIVGAALLLGVSARRFVWATRLDAVNWLRLLRMKSDWYYTRHGRLPGLPRVVVAVADVLARVGSETSLYSGVVAGYDFTGGGDLKTLILEDARRGKGRGPVFEWKDIPGDRFVLLADTIASINMRYYEMEPVGSGWGRRAWSVKNFLLALILEENV